MEKHTCEFCTLLRKTEILFKFLTLLHRKTCSLGGAGVFLQPLSHFVVWDHSRTIVAYWPSSVSMGTQKPFLLLLRLESYLLLFYFGICSCGLSGDPLLLLQQPLSQPPHLPPTSLPIKPLLNFVELHFALLLCPESWCCNRQNGSLIATSLHIN